MINGLKHRLENWREDTNEKYQLEETGAIRGAELAATLAAINNVLQMIDQMEEERNQREGYYRTKDQ